MLTARQKAKFWDKVQPAAQDDCWLWTAATDTSGYGRFSVGGKRLDGAHRVSFLLSGQTIPDGAVIDHVCRHRLCVNPRHLRAVDRLTNVHENSDAPAHLNALKTHCPRGHAYDAKNTIIKRDRRYCRECENARQRTRRRAAEARQSGPSGIAPTLSPNSDRDCNG